VTFTVEWSDAALDALAAIWLAASDRNAVTAAAHAVDQTLVDDADTVGRIVFDTVREYHQPPLGVEFEVLLADARVWVLMVWDLATGRPAASGH
jgi:hypothetical protein